MSQILMGLVIAMFVITAAYVGMHAAEEKKEYKKDYADGHSIEQEISIFDENESASLMLSIASRMIV